MWAIKLKLNLNIENDKVEIPYKPTFRVAIPFFEEDKFTGIVIINVLMDNLLKAISTSSVFEHYIVDKDDNYILHPNNEFSFNKYKNITRNLKDDFENGLNTKGIYVYPLKDILKPLYSLGLCKVNLGVLVGKPRSIGR